MRRVRLFFACLFSWGPAAGDPRRLREAQIILTQAASDMADGSISRANKLLAAEAKRLSESLGISVFAQGEVARALDELGAPPSARTAREPIPDALFSKSYQGTHGVARAQERYCRERGMTKALVVAARPHAWRAARVYERLGIEAILPPEPIPPLFDPGMSQRRWTSAWRIYPYEFAARIYFFLKGLI